nr:hypothetical protein [Caballeronia sp. SBC2]
MTHAQQSEVIKRLASEETVSQLARDYAIARQSIIRVRHKAISA